MRRSILTSSFVLLLAVASASAAGGAPAAFGGKVCQLLTAKQSTAIKGISSRCTPTKPSQGPGSKIYVGTWAAKSGVTPSLQVTVSVYSDAGMLKLATSNLKQGLPSTPHRVSGIGSGAYESTSPTAVGIHFVKGKDIVVVILSGSGAASSKAAVEAAARGAAAKL